MSKQDQRDPQSFRERVAGHNELAQTLIDVAVITGYGVGCTKAHVRPVLQRLGDKLCELTPEAAKLVCSAYRHAVEFGLEEETLRRAERADARGPAAALQCCHSCGGAKPVGERHPIPNLSLSHEYLHE